MFKPKDILIFGAGSAEREVLTFIKEINHINNQWNVLGFVEKNKQTEDSLYLDFRKQVQVKQNPNHLQPKSQMKANLKTKVSVGVVFFF